MIYQSLMVGKDLYFVSVGDGTGFQAHRHPEIELSYCISGSYDILVGSQRLCMAPGDLVLVSPMTAHEFPESTCPTCRKLTVEVGPALLDSYFLPFNSMAVPYRLYRLEEAPPACLQGRLKGLLDEIAEYYVNKTEYSDLLMKGNTLKVSALLLQLLQTERPGEDSTSALQDITKIEKALEIIYSRYAEPLDIETVSAACGYGKSNFCKIFKAVTGETFHNMLNRYRIEVACLHLQEKDLTVEKIAYAVGFSDAKSFCRVFRNQMGETSGAYRKRIRRISRGG